MHKIIKLAGAVVLGLVVSACSKNETSDKGTIGIAMPSKAEARWVSDGSSIVDSLKKLGYARAERKPSCPLETSPS